MMTSLTFRILVTPEKFPNFVSHWYIWLFLPCHMIPYPIRSLRFIIRYKVNRNPPLKKSQLKNASCSKKFWDWFRRHPKFLTDTFFFNFQQDYSCDSIYRRHNIIYQRSDIPSRPLWSRVYQFVFCLDHNTFSIHQYIPLDHLLLYIQIS